VDVGGVPGVMLESTITKPYENPGCPAPCVFFFSTGNVNAFGLGSQRFRHYILEVGGQTLWITIIAPKDRFVRSIQFK
jgi:hypothetical protein